MRFSWAGPLLTLLLALGPGAAVAQLSLSPAAKSASPAAKQAPAPAPKRATKAAPPRAAAAPTQTANAAPDGPANALQGFSQNRDQPVKIGARTLEVRDKEKQATFSGDVQLVQGDTVMHCASLVVFYDDQQGGTAGSGGMKTAGSMPGGSQSIKRVEARGGVHVTQKDQTATGDKGIFDMQSNTVTLVGNVTVVRGQDVLRGQKLVVDLTSGVSVMEAGPQTGGRVEGMFHSSGGNNSGGIKGFPGVGNGRPQQPRVN